MSYTNLVTTFRDDEQQFRMFCHCFSRNWQGNRDLIVCAGSDEPVSMWKNITDAEFDKTWNIEIKPSIHRFNNGVTEQQANTVYYSVASGRQDVIVWDCKDFLLRPFNYENFKPKGKYRTTYILNKQRLVNLGYDMSGLVDTPIDHISAISNIRPWIWNVPQLSRYWQTLNEKFGHYSTWDGYPAGCEIYGYLIYALQDKERDFSFATHCDQPLLFAGGYTFQTYEGMLQDEKAFDQTPTTVVWKHSRKLQDSRCLEVTRRMLIKYGIAESFVDQVYG